MRMFGMPLY